MKNKYVLIILLNLLVILPLLYLCFYTYPTSDDFSYGISLIKSGFIETNIHRYLNWTSRYFATSILITSPLAFDSIKYFGIYPLIFIILFLLAFYQLFKALGFNNKKSVLTSASFLSIYTLLLTSLSENYYWLAGSITYFLPSIIFVFYITLLIKSYDKNKLKYYVFTLLSLFVIGGCTEILVGFSFIATALATAYFYYTKSKWNTFYIFNLFVLVLLIGFIILSPGNNQREGVTLSEIGLIEVVLMSFRKVVTINIRYVILLCMFIFPLIYFLNINIKIKKGNNYLYQILGLYIAMNIFILLGSFVAIYSLKEFYPPRVENLLIFVSMLFIIFISILLNSKLQLNSTLVLSMIVISTLMYLLIPKNEFQTKSNIALIYDDIFSGKVVDYKKQIQYRDNYLRNCTSDCEIDRIQNPPKSIMFKDIGDEDHYVNKSMSVFYNVNKISPK